MTVKEKAVSPIQTFANTTEEVHAIGYGLAAGFFSGLTYGTSMQTVGVGVVGSVLGAALGLKDFAKMDNGSVVKELHKEPQYALGALVVGFVVSIVCRIAVRYTL